MLNLKNNINRTPESKCYPYRNIFKEDIVGLTVRHYETLILLHGEKEIRYCE